MDQFGSCAPCPGSENVVLPPARRGGFAHRPHVPRARAQAEQAELPERLNRLIGRWWLGAVSLVTAVAVSGLLSAALLIRLPHKLTASTDIVGYPIFADYNADRLKDAYYIGVLFFPITALFLYLVLSWLLRRWRWLTAPAQAIPRAGEGSVTSGSSPAAPWARVAAVGIAFALGAAIAFGNVGAAFWVTLGVITATYAGLVVGASLMMGRVAVGNTRFVANMSRVTLLAAPLPFLGVVGASAVTRVTVLSDGSVHSYPWLPLWAGGVITGAGLAGGGVRLCRGKG